MRRSLQNNRRFSRAFLTILSDLTLWEAPTHVPGSAQLNCNFVVAILNRTTHSIPSLQNTAESFGRVGFRANDDEREVTQFEKFALTKHGDSEESE